MLHSTASFDALRVRDRRGTRILRDRGSGVSSNGYARGCLQHHLVFNWPWLVTGTPLLHDAPPDGLSTLTWEHFGDQHRGVILGLADIAPKIRWTQQVTYRLPVIEGLLEAAGRAVPVNFDPNSASPAPAAMKAIVGLNEVIANEKSPSTRVHQETRALPPCPRRARF
jgi:hypothetical protein